MRKLFGAALVVMTVCTLGLGAMAEVPFLVPVVGVLTDADDVPLEGSYEVVFTLYSAETGGLTLWGETQDVDFDDGLFRVYLGSSTIDGMDITDFIDNESVWLGIRVGADGEMNRVRLASVPWAFEAATCGQVTDLSAAGIQGTIGADACGAGQAMRGWTGSAAQCIDLPDVSGLLANADIGTTVQAPIDQALLPCNYGIQQISAAGAVVCANQDVVTQCGEGAGGGSADNYLGSDGACHKAPHACAPGEVLDGDGNCYVPMPIGMIVMWSGSIANIPAGWALCDGTNGTPNLRDRFIVGAGTAYAVGATGGAGSVTLTTAQIPAHNHAGSTASTGSHSHTGTTATVANHSHTMSGYSAEGVTSSGCTSSCDNYVMYNDDGQSGVGSRSTSSTGGHSHTFTTSSTGAHTHTVTISSTGSGQSHENRPPYYALAYIMRVSYQ